MSEGALEGGCLCGAVRYRARGAARNLCTCHCRSCQRATGAPSVAWGTFDASGFETTRGALATVRSSPRVLRGFCRDCGTSLTYVHDARPNDVDVTLASLDDPGALRPERHIWVSDKPPWAVLGDGLPAHPEWGGGEG